MIRPSALQLAEKCGLSAKLAAEHPEGSEAAERGTAVHEDVAAWLRDGRAPTTPEGKSLAESWTPAPADKRMVEHKVRLVDPETNALLTAGTADYMALAAGTLHLADWKTGRPEYVEDPDDNLQLHAYALAAALEYGANDYVVSLCFLSADEVPIWKVSRVYGHDEWGRVWDRVALAASRPPVAVKGPHCQRCWQRLRCPAYLVPADPVARNVDLVPLTSTDVATPDRVLRLHLAAKAMREIADRGDEYVKAYVREHGPLGDGAGKELALVEVAGRRSVSLGPAEKAGLLPQLEAAGAVSRAMPSQQLRWRKAGVA